MKSLQEHLNESMSANKFSNANDAKQLAKLVNDNEKEFAKLYPNESKTFWNKYHDKCGPNSSLPDHEDDQEALEYAAKHVFDKYFDKKKLNESEEKNPFKVGDKITKEKHAGLHEEAEVTHVTGDMVSYTTKSGDSGNLHWKKLINQ